MEPSWLRNGLIIRLGVGLCFILAWLQPAHVINTDVCNDFPRNDSCLLPKCYCNATAIPGDIPPEMTPQMIVFTYSGPVTEEIRTSLREVFSDEYINRNGCPIGITVFATNISTDYCSVHRMYVRGHEIATYGLNGTNPKGVSKIDWKERFVFHRNMLIEKGHLPEVHVIGARAPNFKLGGERQFAAVVDGAFLYDSTIQIEDDILWPFTLDVKLEDLIGDCKQSSCPKVLYPGLWVVPTAALRRDDRICYTLDECVHTAASERQVAAMLHANLAKHRTNRAPMIINVNTNVLGKERAKEGLRIFIEEVLRYEKDVWIVTMSEMLEWVRTPVPVSQLPRFEPWDCPDRIFYTGCETPCTRNKSDAGRLASPFTFLLPTNDLWWYQVIALCVSYIFVWRYDRTRKK